MLNAQLSGSGVILFLKLPPLSAELKSGDLVSPSAGWVAY